MISKACLKIEEKSLSARRAWIEIGESNRNSARRDTVALRKESVDRNNEKALLRTDSKVALRKESVDRNCGAYRPGPGAAGRSPQGERG